MIPFLICFTKFSLSRKHSRRIKFSQTYKKITSSFGVDYFLPLPLEPVFMFMENTISAMRTLSHFIFVKNKQNSQS